MYHQATVIFIFVTIIFILGGLYDFLFDFGRYVDNSFHRSDLMTARPDIRVLDATIRDGGLVNNFMFTDDFINALYRANVKAGIDYMEFGYKASKELFDVNKFGKWKFCDEGEYPSCSHICRHPP